MNKRRSLLSAEEIAQPFRGAWGDRFKPTLSVEKLAFLLDLSCKTIYEWIAKGRLDGCFRKRGKHILIWRARALDILYNGKDWTDD